MTNTGKYSPELKNMQEQSLNKMREMYSKSKNPTQNHSSESAYQGKRFSENKNSTEKKIIISEKKKSESKPPPIMTNFLDAILKDPDKTLIITLIILLMDNEENFTMIMVLFYLLA